jgi:hypothetical protein
MPRSPDSGQLDLAEVFYSVQERMLAQLAVGGFFEHPSAAGSATERHWLDLFDSYLPKRYRATPAFVIDSHGRRSRQIDIAIFDNLYSPLLFPHESGLHYVLLSHLLDLLVSQLAKYVNQVMRPVSGWGRRFRLPSEPPCVSMRTDRPTEPQRQGAVKPNVSRVSTACSGAKMRLSRFSPPFVYFHRESIIPTYN